MSTIQDGDSQTQGQTQACCRGPYCQTMVERQPAPPTTVYGCRPLNGAFVRGTGAFVKGSGAFVRGTGAFVWGVC
ncbi:hypothetical protein ACOMHN_005842 [Nucella lapillus]